MVDTVWIHSIQSDIAKTIIASGVFKSLINTMTQGFSGRESKSRSCRNMYDGVYLCFRKYAIGVQNIFDYEVFQTPYKIVEKVQLATAISKK